MRQARRVLIGAVSLVSIVWVCDYLSLRYRIPKNREPIGVVQVRRYYAVRMKDNKTEFMFDPPESKECVHSLFPHYGDMPCWYARRHAQQRIDVAPPSLPSF